MGSYKYAKISEEIPPIPIITLQLTTPESFTLRVDCRAILDTGSDCTLVPLPLLMQVKAKVAGIASHIPFSGTVTLATPFKVGLIFDRYNHPNIRVFGCSEYELGDYLIIGRDLMNQHRIEFDGPNETFTIF